MHGRLNRWLRPGPSAIGILALVLVGCGGGKTKVDVSGTVSYQGKSIDMGNIRFEPADKSLAPEGSVIKDGAYHVKLPLGKARVSISGAQKNGEKKRYNTPDSPMMSIYKDIVPKKYNTMYNPDNDLSRDITGSTDQLNFDLK
jgi:hypothetical protein